MLGHPGSSTNERSREIERRPDNCATATMLCSRGGARPPVPHTAAVAGRSSPSPPARAAHNTRKRARVTINSSSSSERRRRRNRRGARHTHKHTHNHSAPARLREAQQITCRISHERGDHRARAACARARSTATTIHRAAGRRPLTPRPRRVRDNPHVIGRHNLRARAGAGGRAARCRWSAAHARRHTRARAPMPCSPSCCC